MTDEAIFLDSLKFIREITSNEGMSHVDIFQTLWWNFTPQRQHYLYTLLLEQGLITVNESAQKEVKLGAPANKYIINGDLKLRKKFLKYLKKQPDIMLFMIDNFIKPDPSGHFTRNEFDNGANFLRGLKRDGLIDYEDVDLSHVSGDWYEDPPQNTKKKWFDNQHQPMFVTIVYRRLRAEKLPTLNPINRQTTDQIKNTRSGTWPVRMLNKIIDNAVLLFITIIGGVAAALLVIMIVNYYHCKGFTL